MENEVSHNRKRLDLCDQIPAHARNHFADRRGAARVGSNDNGTAALAVPHQAWPISPRQP
jgi:hypothetical protein